MTTLKPILILGGCITGFFFSLQLINNLPSMFTDLQKSILASTTTIILLIIVTNTISKMNK